MGGTGMSLGMMDRDAAAKLCWPLSPCTVNVLNMLMIVYATSRSRGSHCALEVRGGKRNLANAFNGSPSDRANIANA